ncbi:MULTISPECIES: RES family NAD+ phosphorylase [unclassified Pseudomonas]|uniref:RES family NAD+ phosphorylase n=1 Tax=unclassified Pseudomonas TaxID=196821 RepID=UPI000CD08E2B|nr:MULTISPECIES: RES family NAD+ phosphorylase [unclassified Pseudomonas]POA25689.1 RES domain-containing protein [Pseudomonas sp. FW305-3-2-15-E-TSA4]POA45101.1 RES domain-containing protein [Pseudomonas sp. FW305-3-2-15-E-TSA2]
MDEILEPICGVCIHDDFLRDRILKSGARAECLNCGKENPSIELDILVSGIAQILVDTVEIGDLVDIWDMDRDRISHTEQQGDPLSYFIGEILRAEDDDDPIIEYVLERLVNQSPGDEGFFDAEAYTRKKHLPFEVQESWIEFRNGLMHKSRFFNHKAKEFLEWLFEGIDSYHVAGFGPGVVRMLDPADCKPIYRARDCTPPKDHSAVILANPSGQLAAPPKELAPAGRMSPAGVPVFYGAFERRTCIAELRPPVGGKVISGQFRLTRKIRVLDFTALEVAYDRKILSYFDPDYRRKVERRQFLKSFHNIISHPVVPDQEHEYLQTQVIAEYLATQHEPPIEGVIFASAQDKHEGGKNIVFFSQVISTEPLPPVADENGWYSLESTPAVPGIEFVPESLMVHSIEQVMVKTKDSKVIDGQLESDIYDFFERDY